MTRASFSVRAACLLALGPAGVISADAALWLGPNWALIGEMDAVVIYDTNLTARRENVEDTYGALAPRLTLSRRGSATRLEIDAQVERTWFNDFTEFNSTDPQANLLLEYPAGPDDEPSTHLDLHWGRRSSTNTDLGRRVRSDDLRGRWDQRILDTGRTVVDLRVDGTRTEYREADLNTNDAIAVEARAGYAIAPELRLGLGYGHAWTRSLGAAGRGDTDGEEDRVTVRLNGDISPKLTGSIETGAVFVSYDGVVERDDTDWIAVVGLQWDATAETSASLRASRMPDFTPEGATVLRSSVEFELTQKIGRGFSLRGGAGWARVQNVADGFEEDRDALILIGGIGYQLTDRFSAELSDRYTRQHADRDVLDFERHLVTGAVTFLF